MFMTLLASLFALLLLLLIVVGGFFVIVYWRLIQRPVPDLNGDVHLPFLDHPGEVLFDKHGVPHIYANNRSDLFRIQGYTHAQDRLWQMEQNRRIAHGTLAEVFGEAALDADRFSRIVGFRRAAEAELAVLDAETRQILGWYTEGINGYIDLHREKLAAEFNLLRFQPEPWQILDVIAFSKMIGWSWGLNWESELTRLVLSQQLDPIRAADLEGDYPAQSPIILEAMGEAEATRMLSTAGLLLDQYEKIQTWLGAWGAGQKSVQGSNSWVLSPKASLTGRALLCNDPHLPLTIPGTFYENHLDSPNFKVSGASFPGIPGVFIGHNEQISWGITNAMVDVQDLYIEQPHPEDDTRYAYQGEWEEAQVIEEPIHIRRQNAPHIERVLITRHGPLISGLPNELEPTANTPLVPLALCWQGQQTNGFVSALLSLNQANNWAEFDAALEGWSTPVLNFLYADTHGYIGYLMAGDVPIRPNHLGLVSVPGWTGEYEWTGSIPHAELPRLFNPESGKIVAANHKMVGDDYPHLLGIEFDPGWRAKRLEEMLGTKERFTLRDMEEMQLDPTSAYAAALAPWLTLLKPNNTWERIAINALRNWGYRMEVDSIAATLFHFTLLQLLEMTFGDKLGDAMPSYLGITNKPLSTLSGFNLRAESRLLDLISNHEQSPWYTEISTGRERSREELLQEALSQALDRLRETVGDSTKRWAWGRMHQIRFVHPMGSVRMLRTFFNRGPYPIEGDGTTPNLTHHPSQFPLELVQTTASYRQIYEVGVWDRAQTVTVSGQSGHPLSKQYDDQIPMWREGVYHQMPWSREAVEAVALYRMRFTEQ